MGSQHWDWDFFRDLIQSWDHQFYRELLKAQKIIQNFYIYFIIF